MINSQMFGKDFSAKFELQRVLVKTKMKVKKILDVVVERHRRGLHRLLELRHHVGGLPHPQEVEPLEGARKGRVERPRLLQETQ
jgi:hypothetical protein